MQVHFIVAACENMISGTGMRPGDIITASNGKTIEVYSLLFAEEEMHKIVIGLLSVGRTMIKMMKTVCLGYIYLC